MGVPEAPADSSTASEVGVTEGPIMKSTFSSLTSFWKACTALVLSVPSSRMT